MNRAKKTYRGLLFVFLMISIGLLSIRLPDAKAQNQETVKMYMLNSLTGDSTFNLSSLQLNSIFTVDFYIGNITNLLTWQMDLSYNSSLIHFTKASFPQDNVFKEAIDHGMTPLSEVANNEDNTTTNGNLFILMTGAYNPSEPNQWPVNATYRTYLCQVNFTIISRTARTEIDFITTQKHQIYFSPPYYLPNYTTCAETVNGTYAAGGDPAIIIGIDPLPEFPSLVLLWATFSVTITLIAVVRKKAPKANMKRAR